MLFSASLWVSLDLFRNIFFSSGSRTECLLIFWGEKNIWWHGLNCYARNQAALGRGLCPEGPLSCFEAGLSLILPCPAPKFLPHLQCNCCQTLIYSGTFYSEINCGQVTSWHLRSLEATFRQRTIRNGTFWWPSWTGLKGNFIFSSHSLQ